MGIVNIQNTLEKFDKVKNILEKLLRLMFREIKTFNKCD